MVNCNMTIFLNTGRPKDHHGWLKYFALF